MKKPKKNEKTIYYKYVGFAKEPNLSQKTNNWIFPYELNHRMPSSKIYEINNQLLLANSPKIYEYNRRYSNKNFKRENFKLDFMNPLSPKIPYYDSLNDKYLEKYFQGQKIRNYLIKMNIVG